jgi:hypothetical protein
MVSGKESGFGEAFLAGNGVTAAQDDGEGIDALNALSNIFKFLPIANPCGNYLQFYLDF